MPQTDVLKSQRWKKVSKNSEFEDMCDPFMTSRRRYKVEFNRYLSNVNLNFLPPMPRPVAANNSKKTSFNYPVISNYSNMKISNKSLCNNYTDSNDTTNKKTYLNQRQPIHNYTNQNLMTRSTEFY